MIAGPAQQTPRRASPAPTMPVTAPTPARTLASSHPNTRCRPSPTTATGVVTLGPSLGSDRNILSYSWTVRYPRADRAGGAAGSRSHHPSGGSALRSSCCCPGGDASDGARSTPQQQPPARPRPRSASRYAGWRPTHRPPPPPTAPDRHSTMAPPTPSTASKLESERPLFSAAISSPLHRLISRFRRSCRLPEPTVHLPLCSNVNSEVTRRGPQRADRRGGRSRGPHSQDAPVLRGPRSAA